MCFWMSISVCACGCICVWVCIFVYRSAHCGCVYMCVHTFLCKYCVYLCDCICVYECVSVHCLCERCVYNCANVSISVVTPQCLSVHLCVCEYTCLCVCQRAWERVCAVATRLHLPAIRPIAPRWRRSRDSGPGAAPGERAARCCHRRRAPLPFKSVSKPITADLPRDVLPSVSRSELPEDSPPARGGVCGSCNFGQSSGWPGRPHGATLPGTSEAPGTSPGQEAGGSGGERAWTQPSAPRTRAAPRPGGRPGCPVRSVWKGGALCQPGLQRASPGGSRPGDGCEAGVSPLLSPRALTMQKSVRYNEGHALYLAFLARKEGTKRGFLSKKAAEASRWHEKWFALYQNVLFYFEGEQSGRPAGMYLLEGCSCERAPAPPRAGAGPGGARDALDKQVPRALRPSFPASGRGSQTLLSPEAQGATEPWVHARASPAALAAPNLHAPPRLHPSLSPPPCHQWE